MEVEDVPHIKLAIERGLGAGVEKLAGHQSISGDFDDIRNIDLLNELAEFGGQVSE